MKESSIRFTLIVLSIFPPLALCAMLGVHSLLALLTRGDISAIPYGFPFLAAIGVYGYFVRDTLRLYKEGK